MEAIMLGMLATPIAGRSLGRTLENMYLGSLDPLVRKTPRQIFMKQHSPLGFAGMLGGLGLGLASRNTDAPIAGPAIGAAGGAALGSLLPMGNITRHIPHKGLAALAPAVIGAGLGGALGYTGQKIVGGTGVLDAALPAAGALAGYKLGGRNKLLGIALGGIAGAIARNALKDATPSSPR